MIKYTLVYSTLAFCSAFHPAHTYDRAITYETPGGRLGDQLIAYMHAKWVSYLYDIPLLYKPFHYSNDLVLDDKEKLYRTPLSFEFTLKVEDLNIIAENTHSDVLYIIPYFPESSYELKLAKWPYFPVDWQDPYFLSLLRTLIYPKSPLPQTDLPKDRITVAAHVRRGGGFDDPALQGLLASQIPTSTPLYIAQIRKNPRALKAAAIRPYFYRRSLTGPHRQKLRRRALGYRRGLRLSIGGK